MDKLSFSILSSNPSDAGNGRLGLLARTASKRYVEDGVKLSDAISEIAKDEGLSPAQVRRVCEEANVATFRSLFEKQADKNVSFPLADFKEVVGSRDEPAQESRASIPVGLATGYVPGEDSGGDDYLERLFGVGEKTASADEPHANPRGGMIRMREMLQGVRDEHRAKADTLGSISKTAEAEMTSLAVQHVLGGGSVGEVVCSLSPFSQGPGPLTEALEKISTSLLAREAITRSELVASLEKRAAAPPNPEHPLIQSFLSWQEASYLQKVSRHAVTVTGEQLARIDEALGVG